MLLISRINFRLIVVKTYSEQYYAFSTWNRKHIKLHFFNFLKRIQASEKLFAF